MQHKRTMALLATLVALAMVFAPSLVIADPDGSDHALAQEPAQPAEGDDSLDAPSTDPADPVADPDADPISQETQTEADDGVANEDVGIDGTEDVQDERNAAGKSPRTVRAEASDPVTSFEELRAAVPPSGSATIALGANIECTSTIEVPAGITLTLEPQGDAATLTSSTTLFRVAAGGTLVLGEGVVVKCGTATAITSSGSVVVNGGSILGQGSQVLHMTGGDARLELSSGAIAETNDTGSYQALCLENGASATISGGTVTGIVYVYNSHLTMKDGVITAATGSSSSYSGVHVIARGSGNTSTFDMSGGTIQNFHTTSTGGGVTVEGGNPYTPASAVFTMSGGTIQNNIQDNANAGGGGVYVLYAGEFYMTGGTITNNQGNMGGGVATNDGYYWKYGSKEYELTDPTWPDRLPARFEMRGGTISNNRATNSGGGIYSLSKHVDLYAGTISGNRAGHNGGGMYTSITPFVITLYDALITNNTASVLGGGAWFCPTGDVDAEITDGAANYGNTADKAGNDVAFSHTGNTASPSIVAERMLGGGPANWYVDGRVVLTYDVRGTGQRPGGAYDKPYEHDWNGKSSIALKAQPDAAAIALAKSRAKLFITNNSAGWGGGVGSNGHVKVGRAESKKVTVTKAWGIPKDGNARALSSVDVILEITGDDGVLYQVEKVSLNSSNGWTHTFEDLPLHAKVNVVEDALAEPGGWVTYYEDGGEATDDSTHTHENFTVTNAREGKLQLSKRVSGDLSSTSDVFEYAIRIVDDEGNPFMGRDGSGGTAEFAYALSGTSSDVAARGSIRSGDVVRLSHGQTITISGIPHGAHYEVHETTRSAYGNEVEIVRDDGVVGMDAETGTITGDHTTSLAYTNIKDSHMGGLRVSKAVVGDAAETDKTFHFMLRLYDESGEELAKDEFVYLGDEEGYAASGHVFPLKDGESLTIAGIPTGVRWEVKEVATDAHGYEIEPVRGDQAGAAAETGIIASGQTAELAYTNEKNHTMGALAVSKTVESGDKDRDFEFRVTFGDAEATAVDESSEVEFAYVGDREGVVALGGTIALSHGQRVVIEGLPQGMSYTVQEVGATDYEVVAQGSEGVVEAGKTAEASFVNRQKSAVLQPSRGGATPRTGDATPAAGGILALAVAALAAGTHRRARTNP